MTKETSLEAYKSGYISVSDGHQLYYELYGNPKGIPVLFLHGGPGAGFSDSDKQFFNKSRYNVIFFDQRGSSRSKPFGSIENNTTQHLFKDINQTASGLISDGLKKGDRVALFADNNPQWITAALGINYAGLVDVPRGSDSTDVELKYILEHSEAKAVIVENEKLFNRIKQIAPKGLTNIITLNGSFDK